jgi:hypothetical protein
MKKHKKTLVICLLCHKTSRKLAFIRWKLKLEKKRGLGESDKHQKCCPHVISWTCYKNDDWRFLNGSISILVIWLLFSVLLLFEIKHIIINWEKSKIHLVYDKCCAITSVVIYDQSFCIHHNENGNETLKDNLFFLEFGVKGHFEMIVFDSLVELLLMFD